MVRSGSSSDCKFSHYFNVLPDNIQGEEDIRIRLKCGWLIARSRPESRSSSHDTRQSPKRTLAQDSAAAINNTWNSPPSYQSLQNALHSPFSVLSLRTAINAKSVRLYVSTTSTPASLLGRPHPFYDNVVHDGKNNDEELVA